MREGDVNSKFFHISIRSRRSRNSIKGLSIGAVWCENPVEVKRFVKEFFEEKFREQCCVRPTLDGVEFPKLNTLDRASLA